MVKATVQRIIRRFPRLQPQYYELISDCQTEVWLANRKYDKSRGTKRSTLIGTYLVNFEKKIARAFRRSLRTEQLDDMAYEENRDIEEIVDRLSLKSREIFTTMATHKTRGPYIIRLISRGDFVRAHKCLKDLLEEGYEAGYSELLRMVIELVKLGEIVVAENTCEKCRHWDGDYCYLNPVSVAAAPKHHCGQFSWKRPSREVLETDVTLLPDIPARVKSVLLNLGLRTVEDLLLVGPSAIRQPDTLGRIDVVAIRLIRASLEKLEVVW